MPLKKTQKKNFIFNMVKMLKRPTKIIYKTPEESMYTKSQVDKLLKKQKETFYQEFDFENLFVDAEETGFFAKYGTAIAVVGTYIFLILILAICRK